MLTYRYIFRLTRHPQRSILNKNQALFYSKSSGSDSSSSSDDESKKKKLPQKEVKETKVETTAINKLNLLLQQMVADDANRILDLAKPKTFTRKKVGDKSEKEKHEKISDPSEKQIIAAAKLAAESVGGDIKQTESELLAKLLSPVIENTEENSKPSNLSDIIVGMKIDRTNKEKISAETSRAHQVRELLKHSEGKKPSREGKEQKKVTRKYDRVHKDAGERIDLYGSKPLGIFSPEKMGVSDAPINKTWDALEARDLKLAVTHPPSNYFQQMILWTEQGKLWKFPIDNEQGIGAERDVYFAEHVFLDRHLEPWCPKQGPIRHFMELVCVGLSKNPYISVQNKKDHIEWFRDYFTDKMQLLQELGAVPAQSAPQSAEQPKAG